jgi:gentisate 1,2-dioxygenase
MHYSWADTRQALRDLEGIAKGSLYDGLIMEYTNPLDGGPVMPTLGCYVQMLRPRERTQGHRHTSSAVYHVVEGTGCSIVGSETLEWEDKDVFAVPAWTGHHHENLSHTDPAFLFSFTDVPVMRALDLLREEPVS